jgi:two-component system chemotaxis response regulator CheY
LTTLTLISPSDIETLVEVRTLDLFHFANKIEERPPMTLDETSTDTVSRIRRKRCRIFVVDDEDVFRASLVFKLRDLYGATVEEAESGSVALERASEERGFNLILMDISMPGMNGLEVCEAIRAQGVDTRIVLMSAYCSDDNRAKAESLGVTLLNKPLDERVLQSILLECEGEETP